MKLPSFGLLLLLVACSSPEEKKTAEAGITAGPAPGPTTAPTDTTSTEQTAPSREAVFDVPALLGKNIDEITRLLGKPGEPDASNLTVDELERRYSRKGYRLIINYDQKTRQVAGFFLSAPGLSGETKDCGSILKAGNLNPASTAYAIDTLRSERKGYFTGVAVTTE